MTEAVQRSLGSQRQETCGEMAPIECDVHSHTAFLEQDVSILRTHRRLQCEMLVHTRPVSHDHRLERHSRQTYARFCVEEQTELQAEVAFGDRVSRSGKDATYCSSFFVVSVQILSFQITLMRPNIRSVHMAP